jgi:hypothetical protein
VYSFCVDDRCRGDRRRVACLRMSLRHVVSGFVAWRVCALAGLASRSFAFLDFGSLHFGLA